MPKTTLNFLLDLLLLLTFMTLAVTAVIVRFVFPPGTQADDWILWGAGYDAWAGLWFNFVAVLALLVLVHVMLHWSWVCGVVAQRLSKWRGKSVRIDEANQTVYGVGLLVVLFTISGIVIAAAALGLRDADASRSEQSGQVGVSTALDDG
jgi:hypothetical protein